MPRSFGVRQAVGPYSRMGPRTCEQVHMTSLEILERVGIEVHDEQARSILADGGAAVDGLRVRIPPHAVEQALSVTPSRITLCDREGHAAIRAWGYDTYFGGGSDCLYVLDHQTGNRRKAVLDDVRQAATLMNGLPGIDFVMSAFLPSDVDQQAYDRYQMEVMLNNTSKPIVFVTPDFEGCVTMVEMCEIVAGGAKPFRDRPFATCYINVTSGLVANEEATQKCVYLA
ncbi:MAG: trimethylamine methyltransferase family protein, partial [Anaerolineae bacterium]